MYTLCRRINRNTIYDRITGWFIMYVHKSLRPDVNLGNPKTLPAGCSIVTTLINPPSVIMWKCYRCRRPVFNCMLLISTIYFITIYVFIRSGRRHLAPVPMHACLYISWYVVIITSRLGIPQIPTHKHYLNMF